MKEMTIILILKLHFLFPGKEKKMETSTPLDYLFPQGPEENYWVDVARTSGIYLDVPAASQMLKKLAATFTGEE